MGTVGLPFGLRGKKGMKTPVIIREKITYQSLEATVVIGT